MLGKHIKVKQKLNSVTFKKSPNKYDIFDSTYHTITDSHQFQNQNTLNRPKQPKYNLLKKIPDDYASLRKTYDHKNNSKFNSQLVEYSFEDKNDPNMMDLTLRKATNKSNNTDFDNQNRLATSVSFKMTFPFQNHQRQQKKFKKVQKNQKNMTLDNKFQDYIHTLQKYKDQLQISTKMSDQLKKLKEDRRKRLQAKQKQQNTSYKNSQYQKYKFKQSINNKNLQQPYLKHVSSSYDFKRYLQKNTTLKVIDPIQPFKSKQRPATSKQIIVSQDYKVPKLGLKDFVIGKILGQGKFGKVYQTIHKKTGFLFALKKIPKQMIKSHMMTDQFILELKLQSFLNHANILTVFGFFDDNQFIYIVLQYMQQGTLFSQLKKNKRLNQKQVSSFIRQVSSAIQYMQQNAIAHRDIKPQNIVISHGVCKLCDFGWATKCQDRRSTYCGTFDYAPPQILQGVQYDYTVDLWCLGVLTYELLVGKAPFYHISRKETKKKIMNVESKPIQYPNYLSLTTISFIDQLLKKNPDERMTITQLLSHPFLKDVKN